MVREAKSENLAAIKKLMQTTFDNEIAAESTEEEKNKFTKILDSDFENIKLWYYTLDDKIVATMGIEGDNHLCLSFVDDEYKSRGAAKELFEAIKAILMARAQFTVVTTVHKNFVSFFEKLNFHETSKRSENFISMTYTF